MNLCKNNNKKLEAKPPKFTLYKYHIFLYQIQEKRITFQGYQSFISIIVPHLKFVDAKGLHNYECRSFISIIVPERISFKRSSAKQRCRSFISIIFPFTRRKLHVRRVCVSILYKYHISLPYLFKFIQTSNMCRSFISIIFPEIIFGVKYVPKKCRSFISIIFPLLNIAHFGL